MTKTAAARRNRALRKLRACEQIDPEIKLAIEVILDLLNPKSGYRVAWPSNATIGRRIGRSKRSGRWYVRIIKALGIFHWKQFSPEGLREHCRENYGFSPELGRLVGQAPNLFIINEEHPLWNDEKRLPNDVAESMGGTIRLIKSQRNRKTTSRLASSMKNQPAKYSLRVVRDQLISYSDRVANDPIEILLDKVANDPTSDGKEGRENVQRGVANDPMDEVANDPQVFNEISVAEKSPTENSVQIAQGADPSGDLITTRLAPSKPASACGSIYTPPTRHSACEQASQNQSQSEPDAATGTRKRVQGGLTATPIRDRNLLSREGEINAVHRNEALNQLLASVNGRRLAGSKPIELNKFGPRDDAIIETMQRLENEKQNKLAELNTRYGHRSEI